jgi:hypothetical protein
MDKVYEANASATPPAAPTGSTGYPTDGNIGAGIPPTTPGAYWFHMITAELLAVIVAGAITPAKATLTQLRDAINNMITAAFNGTGARTWPTQATSACRAATSSSGEPSPAPRRSPATP